MDVYIKYIYDYKKWSNFTNYKISIYIEIL